jgi:tRNA nucleotidyltransferase (CCA-adding enzyme)
MHFKHENKPILGFQLTPLATRKKEENPYNVIYLFICYSLTPALSQSFATPDCRQASSLGEGEICLFVYLFMLARSSLRVFVQQKRILHDVLPIDAVFFVGGAMRDVLLGITESPKDLDLTLALHPDQVWAQTTDIGCSRFRTEKFGTITLIPHADKEINYEITPFRTEGNYEDFRHPEEITWSESLLEDSKRRDFTINCLYLTVVAPTQLPATQEPPLVCIDDTALLAQLAQHGSVYLQDAHLVILQNHAHIELLFPNGQFSATHAQDFLTQLPHVTLGSIHQDPWGPLLFLIDPHGGLNDLVDPLIRTVGDPHQRFGEDALRIIRGIRFVNILNQHLAKQDNPAYFDIDPSTRNAMKKSYYLINALPKERLHTEIKKVFSANDPFGYVALLDELRILPLLFPAVAATKNVLQPVRYHPFDVYSHTLLTLKALQERNDDRLCKLGMLYHDVGKPEQYHYYSLMPSKEEKKLPIAGKMYHTSLGVPLATSDLRALGCSQKEIDTVCRYINMHHRPGELLDGKEENLVKKLRKLISESGIDLVHNLIDLAIADRIGQYNPMQPPAISGLLAMQQQAHDLYQAEGRFTQSNLAIDGTTIMETFALAPGREVGELLAIAFDRVLTDIPGRNTKEHILEYLEKQRATPDEK